MGCNCGKPKCDGKCGISPAVLQINNPTQCIIFHKVDVPASMGDSTTNPPKTGAYKNVLLYYEADQTSWLYSSDGIPVRLTNGITNYEDAINLPQINGETLIGDKSSADLKLADAPMVITIASGNTVWSGADTTEDIYNFFLNQGKVNVVFEGSENYGYEIVSAAYIPGEQKMMCMVTVASVDTGSNPVEFSGNALYGLMTFYTAGKAVDVGELDLQPKLFIADFTGLELNDNILSGVPATNAYIGMVKPSDGLSVSSDGTLTVIDHVFDTVADMKASTELKNGDYAQTLGFHAIGDGGGAIYKISDTGTADEKEVIAVGGLYATCEFGQYINLKQLGAYGDGTHNDTLVFVKALEKAMDTNKNVFIPSGTFLLDPNVFQMVSRLGYYGNLSLRGNGKTQSILKLNNTTTGQYFSNSTSKQLYAELNFYDIAFIGNDNTANGFYCYSTGTEKRFRFYNCRFELSNVLYCAGTGNADLHRFVNCSAHIYGGAFITLDNSQSVETEIYGTSVGIYDGGKLIKYYKGGCVHFFGGEYETFGTSSDYLLDFADATESMGVGNIGIAFTGGRFEFHNQHKFINATGNKGVYLDFTDCNMGTADTLSSGYYVELTKNSNVKFNRCTINNNIKFHVYTTGTFTDSSFGALLEFKDCIINGRLYNNVTAEGGFSRVIAKGCVNVVTDGIRGSNDFDWNWQQRTDGVVSATTSVNALKRTAEGWPKAGDEFTFTIPPNCFVKKIKIYRPAISASSASYVLHVGNSDKSVVYGETAGTSIFNDEVDIDVEDIGFVADNVIKVWATGEATNITTQGYGYIEYI